MVECGELVLLVKQSKGGAWFRGFKKATSRQSDHTDTHTHPSIPSDRPLRVHIAHAYNYTHISYHTCTYLARLDVGCGSDAWQLSPQKGRRNQDANAPPHGALSVQSSSSSIDLCTFCPCARLVRTSRLFVWG